MGGQLHVYRRENSRFWQCAAFLKGRNHRISTKEESLAQAKEFAEDWFLELRGKVRRGEIRGGGVTFDKAAEQFLKEFIALTAGERSPVYVQGHQDRLPVHLRPFFGKKELTEITPGMVQDYRIHRMTSRKHPQTGEPMRPARNTLHQEIVCLRQVLKCANRHGWLAYLPDLSAPFRAFGKVSHRGWFSLEEYNQLWRATQRRAKNPPKPRWRRSCEQVHDYVLFMANTGLRPVIEEDENGEEPTGRSESESAQMVKPKPTDPLFDRSHRELLKTVLEEEKLNFDREGSRRTAYSLRHTYICLRLMEGADIYQIAKNCRTSVEMIEKYYAIHLKNTLDAAAINVRKSKAKKATKLIQKEK